MVNKRNYKAVILFLSVSFIINITLLAVYYFLNAGIRNLLNTLSFAALFVLLILIVRALKKYNRSPNWLMIFFTVNLFFITPEVILKITNFRYESGVEFGYPRPFDFMRYQPDSVLFWKLSPEIQGINSAGFRGGEFKIPKPKKKFRILYFGDSCVEECFPTLKGFPTLIDSILNGSNNDSGYSYEKITLAMTGYSTFQGKKLIDMYGKILEPDLVVVSYGWNDHWLAFGSVDSEKHIKVDNSFAGRIISKMYIRIKLLQFLNYALFSVSRNEEPLDIVRVPEPEYVSNLTYIGSFFEKMKVPVVFVTAPTTHHKLGVPDYIVTNGYVKDGKEQVIKIHSRYVDLTKNTAKEHNWYLFDLYHVIDTLKGSEKLFVRDGIHYDENGLPVIAKLYVDFFRNEGLIK